MTVTMQQKMNACAVLVAFFTVVRAHDLNGSIDYCASEMSWTVRMYGPGDGQDWRAKKRPNLEEAIEFVLGEAQAAGML